MGYEQELASFIFSYKTDETYRREIKNRYYNNLPLTDLQIHALENIIKIEKRKPIEKPEEDQINRDYTKANEILYDTDEEITETLLNLLFGEVLFKKIDNYAYDYYRDRMYDNRFLNTDKIYLIDLAYDDFNKLRPIVTLRFKYVKENLKNGLKEKAFEPYLKYNTNISLVDIYEYSCSEEKMKTK